MTSYSIKIINLSLFDSLQIKMGGLLVCFVVLFHAGMPLQAQQLKPWFTSEIEVVDALDPQVITCNAYQLKDTIIYDTPKLIRLSPNEQYHFKFRFSFMQGLEYITHSNFHQKNYSVKIFPSNPGSFKINAVSPGPDGVSIYGVALGKIGTFASFQIRLLNAQNQLAGDALFDLVIPAQKPDLFFPNFGHEIPTRERVGQN